MTESKTDKPSVYQYECGVQPLCEARVVRPFGTRVLLRAILRDDFYRGALWLPPMQSTDADCFEVIAIGGGVKAWCEKNNEVAPEVGDHVEVRSTAADRVDAKNLTGRFWNVSIEDVTQVWKGFVEVTPEIAAACERIIQANASVLSQVSSTGEAELTPVSSGPPSGNPMIVRR